MTGTARGADQRVDVLGGMGRPGCVRSSSIIIHWSVGQLQAGTGSQVSQHTLVDYSSDVTDD